MLTSIKTEIKIWFLTGRAFLLLTFMIGGFTFFALSSISHIKILSLRFDHTIEQVDSDEQIRQVLERPLYDRNGRVNTILQEKIKIEDVLYSLSPKNSISFCGEILIYLLPLFMTIMGGLTISRDLTSDVLRLRVSREGKWKYLIAKQIVMITITAFLTAVSEGLYRITSPMFYRKAASFVNREYIDTSYDETCNVGIFFLRTAFVFLCTLIFLEIGFCVSYIFRTPVVSTAVVCFIWYFNLVTIKCDAKNVIYNIAARFFDFKGVIPNGLSSEIPLHVAVLVAAMMLLLPILILVTVWKKRSAYR